MNMPVAPRALLPPFRIIAVAALVVLAGALAAHGHAASSGPPWHAAVIVSASGGGELGQRQAFAAERSATALQRAGVYGQPLRIDVEDDRGDPRRAEALAREALEAGALVLVCCTSAAATDRVAALAEEEGALLLALDAARAGDRSWVLQLPPTARTLMIAAAVHAAAEGKAALALMTLDNSFGDEAERAFERALADTGREGVGVARYSPAATVLTPEAVWTATREPGSVVVWGLSNDTRIALDGLRRRGYLGPVYVRPDTLPSDAWPRLASHEPFELPAVPTASDPWLAARLAVAPAALATALPPEHPNAPAVQGFVARVVGGDPTRHGATDLIDLAVVDDALQLVRFAFEAVAALGLPETSPVRSRRLATRDALLAAPPQALAAGTYAPRQGDIEAARWQGLVIASVVDDAPR